MVWLALWRLPLFFTYSIICRFTCATLVTLFTSELLTSTNLPSEQLEKIAFERWNDEFSFSTFTTSTTRTNVDDDKLNLFIPSSEAHLNFQTKWIFYYTRRESLWCCVTQGWELKQRNIKLNEPCLRHLFSPHILHVFLCDRFLCLCHIQFTSKLTYFILNFQKQYIKFLTLISFVFYFCESRRFQCSQFDVVRNSHKQQFTF